MEAGRSKTCRVGQQAGDPGEPTFRFPSKGCLLENQPGDVADEVRWLSAGEFLSGGGQSFCSIQVVTWLDEAHPLLYSQATNLNVNFIQKTALQENPE